MRLFVHVRWILLLWLTSVAVTATEVMPSRPEHYFNDYAGVVSPATAQNLNQTLDDFERKTSSQIVVAVFPKMQSDSSLEDYAHRIFESWQIGQKSKNNGALLVVFVQDHRLRIEVGYGLEGALTDALSKRIIEEQIAPNFRKGDYNTGLTAGVTAILQATRGEYKGTGRTAHDRDDHGSNIFTLIFVIIFVLIFLSNFRRGRVYSRGGSSVWIWPSGGGGGGGWSSGGGGGGFSGGGGSSGGGGASGSW